MIQLTEKLIMTADKHCYIVGEPRQRAGRGIGIKDPKYYTTAAQAVKGALATAMRMAVEDGTVMFMSGKFATQSPIGQVKQLGLYGHSTDFRFMQIPSLHRLLLSATQ